MAIEVKMAKLSPTMESGQLVKWLVKVGDKVKEGDTLAEVQTDKAVMPMESFEEGTVARLDVSEGDEVALGQRMLVLASKKEDANAVAAQFEGSSGAPAKGGANAAAAKKDESPDTDAAESRDDGDDASAGGDDNGHELAAVGAGGRIKSSPLARKIAEEAGVDLAHVRGSGPGGRIVRLDVENFLREGPGRSTGHTAPARPAAATTPAAATGPVAEQARSTPAPARDLSRPRATERLPHTRMRKTIADRMQQSKQTAPDIHLTADIRMDLIMAARERLNQVLSPEGVKLSVGDFVTKAVALALRQHPALNASYETDAIVRHGQVNIGIAVALESGLIVPVLKDADLLGLREIRKGTQILAEAARRNKLTSDQLMGGTFTISNLGMYGVKQFDAILNLPEVGILAVGGTEQRPVVENGQLAVGWVMSVTLTADHRGVDGATAAEFLRTLKRNLEEPTAMLL